VCTCVEGTIAMRCSIYMECEWIIMDGEIVEDMRSTCRIWRPSSCPINPMAKEPTLELSFHSRVWRGRVMIEWYPPPTRAKDTSVVQEDCYGGRIHTLLRQPPIFAASPPNRRSSIPHSLSSTCTSRGFFHRRVLKDSSQRSSALQVQFPSLLRLPHLV
jgi:hypothetical protein